MSAHIGDGALGAGVRRPDVPRGLRADRRAATPAGLLALRASGERARRRSWPCRPPVARCRRSATSRTTARQSAASPRQPQCVHIGSAGSSPLNRPYELFPCGRFLGPESRFPELVPGRSFPPLRRGLVLRDLWFPEFVPGPMPGGHGGRHPQDVRPAGSGSSPAVEPKRRGGGAPRLRRATRRHRYHPPPGAPSGSASRPTGFSRSAGAGSPGESAADRAGRRRSTAARVRAPRRSCWSPAP